MACDRCEHNASGSGPEDVSRCKYCGREVAGDFKFCAYCGKKV